MQAIEALKGIGFPESRKENLTIAQLETLLVLGFYPVVYVWLMPIDQARETHALVVTEIDTEVVYVIDPLSGPRQLARSAFEEAFQSTRGLTIIVSQTPTDRREQQETQSSLKQ